LAIGREDGSISIHDLMVSRDKKANNVPLAVLRDHVSAVTCVSWAESGGLFFSSGRDSVINTWLISEEEEVVPPRKKKKSQDGGIAKTVSTKKVTYTRIRTLPVYEQVESLILLSRRYRPASESKGQQEMVDRKDIVLATVGTKGIVRLWKARPTGKEGVHSISDLSLLASQNEIDAFGEDKGGYTSLHLTSLSTTHLSPLLVAVDAEHNMTFLKMGWGRDSSGEEMLQIQTDRAIVGDNGEILDMAVIPGSSKDRHTVAVATNSAQVRIFGLADANKDEIADDETTENSTHSALSPRGLLDGHTAIVLAINASPCGRYLATAGKDKTMRLWHLASRKCIGLATGHTEAVGSVALSKKAGCYDVGGKVAENGAGAFVVTASKDRTLKVWPLPGSAVLNKLAANGEELSLRARLSARAHEKDINIVSVAPNDSLIATGSQDKTVKLWRSTDLALQATLKGHKRGIWDCQFSKTDRVLATASGDRTIKLWSIADSSCVRTFQVRASIQYVHLE
jgi:U3 small nucleolar RNA-associated protein 13